MSNTMQDIIAKVGKGERASKDLTYQEATAAMRLLLEKQATPVQVGAFLLAMRIKSESVAELAALATSARGYVTPVAIPDSLGVVDIPTYAGKQDGWHALLPGAIIAAAAGAHLLLHGYEGVAGRRSTAALASALNIPVDLTPDDVANEVMEKGFGYLDIALYHPPVHWFLEMRKELGVRTFFQPVARLLNPARARVSIIGISHPPYFEKMPEALRMMGIPRALVLRGTDGEPELSLSSVTKAIEIRDDHITPLTIHPKDMGMTMGRLDSPAPKDLAEEAALLRKLLANQLNGPVKDWVTMNAAVILYLAGKAASLRVAVPLALEALASGAAKEKLAAVSGRRRGN
jgi:anthranilate phosphoribosyltransferase